MKIVEVNEGVYIYEYLDTLSKGTKILVIWWDRPAYEIILDKDTNVYHRKLGRSGEITNDTALILMDDRECICIDDEPAEYFLNEIDEYIDLPDKYKDGSWRFIKCN